MGILHFFGKRLRKAPLPNVAALRTTVPMSDAQTGAATAQSAAPTQRAGPPTSAPLHTLTRYQLDPGFRGFQEKMHRPPGIPPRRSRLRDSD